MGVDKIGGGARFVGKLLGLTLGSSVFNGFTAFFTMVIGWGLLPLYFQGVDRDLSHFCDGLWMAFWDWGVGLAGEHSVVSTLFSLINNALKGGFVFKFLILNVLIETTIRVAGFLFERLWPLVLDRFRKPKAAPSAA